MSLILSILVIALGYLLGSFPTAYIVGKIFSQVDIRRLGSGNVGATNVLRVIGIFPGLITLFTDVGKGFLAVWLVSWLGRDKIPISGVSYIEKLEFLPMLAGLASISGHNWPLFLKFKGGKGVATTLGVCLALYSKVIIGIIFVWLFVVLWTRYVSLSSIISGLTIPGFIWLYFRGKELNLWLHLTFGIILALLILWRHQDNIKRLIQHQERKLSFSKNGSI